MTVDSKLTGVLLKGVAASRPAANAVAGGTIYSATDTGAITQSDGSSWSTYATISSGMADPMTTRGDIIVRNASNTTARLAIGSSGKVLSSDGTDVSWQTPAASGALVFLEAHTASSSAQLDFTSFISSTYDVYKIEGLELFADTSTAHLQCRVGTGGGPTYDTGSNYEYVSNGRDTNGTAFSDAASPSTSIRIFKSMTNASGYGSGSFNLTVTGLQSTTARKLFVGTGSYVDTVPNANFATIGGLWETSGTAVTALRFFMSAGNIASGTIRIYGISKS